jgi:2-oxo-3-hexenedioate decarboxylase/2-keto-4-pentenoate hydratase
VTSHFSDWVQQPVLRIVADNGTDGALVLGPPRALADVSPLSELVAELHVNGIRERAGRGCNVLGDPLNALAWLANARRADGAGLPAGSVHSSGTLTSMLHARPPLEACAAFGALGTVQLCVS